MYLSRASCSPNASQQSIWASQGRAAEGRIIPPGAQNPVQEPPGAQNPARDAPGVQNPAQERPGAQNPAQEPPGDQNPTQERPGAQNPAQERPGARIQLERAGCHALTDIILVLRIGSRKLESS